MDLITAIIDIALHLDVHLKDLVIEYGTGVYAILFLIVFIETGLVIWPFLPGDSLLFVTGTLAAAGDMDILMVMLVLIAAALTGDNVNYWIGRLVGPKVFHYERSRWFNPAHLARAHAFYERHGGKTIILARFMPIIRTFAPFVAGVGAMTYGKFLAYNIVGGLLWVGLFTILGYFFGNIPAVQENFTLVIIAIVFLSVLPPIYEVLRSRKKPV